MDEPQWLGAPEVEWWDAPPEIDWWPGVLGEGVVPGARPRKVHTPYWHNHLAVLTRAAHDEERPDSTEVTPPAQSISTIIGPKTLQAYYLDQSRPGFIGPLTELYTLVLDMWEDTKIMEAEEDALYEACEKRDKAKVEAARKLARRDRLRERVKDLLEGMEDKIRFAFIRPLVYALDHWQSHLTRNNVKSEIGQTIREKVTAQENDEVDVFDKVETAEDDSICPAGLDQTKDDFIGPWTERYTSAFEWWKEMTAREVARDEAKRGWKEVEQKGWAREGVCHAEDVSAGTGVKGWIQNVHLKLRQTAAYEMLKTSRDIGFIW